MKIVEEYIKKRKKSVDSSNEKEYLKVLLWFDKLPNL